MTIYIDESHLGEVRRHGERHYPEEGAGLILGVIQGEARIVRKLLPLPNHFQAESRHNRYLIEPKEMLAAEEEAERLGLDVIGVFHSHPEHPPLPSDFDRSWALPWFSYLITSVMEGMATATRSWTLSEDRQAMIEQPLVVQTESAIEEAS